uniref:AAA+ ATPase domain-containing protein n=1 Tax=Chlamydomonas leiostraca TaxID=1034604 RepID=A0A7S0RT80_9CHLO
MIIYPKSRHGFATVKAFIDHCRESYIDENIKAGNLVILRSTKHHHIYSMYPFDTTKSFDNMFFLEKQMIKDRLDMFMSTEDEYKRLGMPYTLGFLFHGAPGTGKTSMIKAIAKYTGRHVVVLSPKNVTSLQMLMDVMFKELISHLKIPIKKRLIVFEEIDCGEWQHIVSARGRRLGDQGNSCNEDAASNHSKLVEALVNTLGENSKKPHRKKCGGVQFDPISGDDPLTLGDFLEALDGIVEMPGRMIIMTSNRPDQLDDALVRPGRIDMAVEFKKMRRQDIAEMYKLWFCENIPRDVYDEIKDYAFSQAEIGSLFVSRPQFCDLIRLLEHSAMNCANTLVLHNQDITHHEQVCCPPPITCGDPQNGYFLSFSLCMCSRLGLARTSEQTCFQDLVPHSRP